MKPSILRNLLNVGLLGAAMVLTMLFGSGLTLARAANPPETAPAIRPVKETGIVPLYAAGTLLRGSNRFVYYVTASGTRQPLMDRETFLAYGFHDEDVVEVADGALAALPVDEALTRLVQNEQGHLYWVMGGRRWQVDDWQPVVVRDSYPGPFISHPDSSLAQALPTRLGLPDGAFLRQGEQVYYFNQGTIIPVNRTRGLNVEISSVPAGVLDLYPQQERLTELTTHLKADTSAANVRRGPGLEYEVMGTAYRANRIKVTGRAENYWLQIEYNNEIGWLAGDLVEDQMPLSLLPLVDTSTIAPAAASQSTPANGNSYFGVGITIDIENSDIVIMSVVEGGPAERYGVKNGDIILAVDGVPTNGSYGLTNSIRGPKGTPVTLTLSRPSTNETFDLTIIRDEINLSTVSWSCADEPIRGFGKAWENHPETHKLLGCAFINFRQDEHATRAAVQTFEHGWLLWLETDTVANVDPIYVFFEDDGSYIRFGDQPLVDAHSYAPTEPGFYKVGDRFAKIYWKEIGEQGRQRLGRATNEARDSLGAFQEFQNGRMFWAGEADTIYVIYQGNYDFDLDGQTTWKQGWLSYEDTFEAAEP